MQKGRTAQTAHQATCTPSAACDNSFFPWRHAGQGAPLQAGYCWQHWVGGGRCKLPKYLISWKDPEDGFAQTTDASQMQRVGQLLPWAAHSNCPFAESVAQFPRQGFLSPWAGVCQSVGSFKSSQVILRCCSNGNYSPKPG